MVVGWGTGERREGSRVQVMGGGGYEMSRIGARPHDLVSPSLLCMDVMPFPLLFHFHNHRAYSTVYFLLSWSMTFLFFSFLFFSFPTFFFFFSISRGCLHCCTREVHIRSLG